MQPARDANGVDIIITEANVDQEVIFMELSKNVLENLYSMCNEVYMPVLANPLNMVGMSDLVSKDLILSLVQDIVIPSLLLLFIYQWNLLAC